MRPTLPGTKRKSGKARVKRREGNRKAEKKRVHLTEVSGQVSVLQTRQRSLLRGESPGHAPALYREHTRKGSRYYTTPSFLFFFFSLCAYRHRLLVLWVYLILLYLFSRAPSPSLSWSLFDDCEDSRNIL